MGYKPPCSDCGEPKGNHKGSYCAVCARKRASAFYKANRERCADAQRARNVRKGKTETEVLQKKATALVLIPLPCVNGNFDKGQGWPAGTVCSHRYLCSVVECPFR